MKIQVVLGSTRPGRMSPRFGAWIMNAAKNVEGVEFEIVDLAEFNIPMFDESISPRYNPEYQPNGAASAFLSKLNEADGYVIVTPEYNHSISGALKNALDYITWQMAKKPVLVTSYGSVGGARAAEHLRNILSECKAVSIPEFVALVGMPDGLLTEDGVLNADLAANPYGPQTALVNGLSELIWWTKTLHAGRVV